MPDNQTVGVLLPYVEGDYFNLLLMGIRDVVQPRGFELLAFQATPSDLKATQLARERVGGWIVVVTTEGLSDIAPSGTPIVTVAASALGTGYPAVVVDNQGGFQGAIGHLCEHGHRRIAFVGCLDQPDVQQRYLGYQAALAAEQIPFDRDLVYEVDSHEEPGGHQAARRMLDAGLPCTAAATTTDEIAIGLLEALQEAGRHIPEDLAIVSFDDIARAQHTRPPLTTIRQRPDELGRTAAVLLLEWMAGKDISPGITYVPTALIVRRSCGCDVTTDATIFDDSDEQAPDWQTALALRLVRLARYPLALASETQPEQIWPRVMTLTYGLAAAAAGTRLPPLTEIEQAWRQVVALTPDLANLAMMLKAIEHAAAPHLNGAPEVRGRVEAFLDTARLGMMHARLAQERTQAEYFQNTVQSNYGLSMRLLSEDIRTIPELDWLAQTDVNGACLGLWAELQAGEARRLVLAGLYHREGGISVQRGASCLAAVFPPQDALPASAHAGGADVTIILPVRTESRDWGLLALCAAPQDVFFAENMLTWASLLGVALDRRALVTSLTEQQAILHEQQETLRTAYERERALADTVRELGSPVIPLLPEVLLVPLIGAMSSERARQVIESVLDGVNRYRATTVLLDITGVPLVDTQVANSLIQTTQAAMLLGAQVILVGMRPEIAQSIIGLGIDLRHIATQPSLAAAVEQLLLLRHQRAGVSPRERRPQK
ncbi:MAG TPA: substrate-binding domain-containing protein [Roseiflexaceae bacterium]|nr:substrate-binding domain-containing protein [Roseiflexaceae bacterium]